MSIETIIRAIVREELEAALSTVEPPKPKPPTRNTWMNERECCEMVGIPVSTLRNWRSTGDVKLPFSRIGRLIRYSEVDVQAFMETRKVG